MPQCAQETFSETEETKIFQKHENILLTFVLLKFVFNKQNQICEIHIYAAYFKIKLQFIHDVKYIKYLRLLVKGKWSLKGIVRPPQQIKISAIIYLKHFKYVLPSVKTDTSQEFMLQQRKDKMSAAWEFFTVAIFK